MKRTFQINNGCELVGEGYCYDLHNDYECKDIQIDDRKKSVIFLFLKVHYPDCEKFELWQKAPSELQVVCKGIDFLEKDDALFETFPAGLSEMGFMVPTQKGRDYLLGDTTNGKPNSYVISEEDHIVFDFFDEKSAKSTVTGGVTIDSFRVRLHCREIIVK